MKEKPIIFSGPMVRAILDGRKTQTRRVVKPQHIDSDARTLRWENQTSEELMLICKSPYGVPGEQLWVRETFRAWMFDDPHIEYRAGGIGFEGDDRCYGIGGGTRREHQRQWDAGAKQITPEWRPSLFMPRWASRITLEVTGVRVERLNCISHHDCCAEGFEVGHPAGPPHWYQGLWNSINKARGHGWESNPFVWAIEFKVVE